MNYKKIVIIITKSGEERTGNPKICYEGVNEGARRQIDQKGPRRKIDDKAGKGFLKEIPEKCKRVAVRGAMACNGNRTRRFFGREVQQRGDHPR